MSESKIQVRDIKGLPPAAAVLVREAARTINRGELPAAQQSLTLGLAYSPRHPELLRLLGVAQMRLGRPQDAIESFRGALESRVDDTELLGFLAHSQALSGDVASAIQTLKLLVSRTNDVAGLYPLAMLLDGHGAIEDALLVSERIVGMDGSHVFARILYARCLVACGRMEEAVAQYRGLIAQRKETAKAWYGLAEIKTMKFDAEDLAALKALFESSTTKGGDRVGLAHALGKAHEDVGDWEAALAAFTEMGRLQRAAFPWNSAEFHTQMARTRAAFEQPVDIESTNRGNEVIFIVGLPRSGSTLTEQILAAHPDVEGASELPDLNAVLQEESQRRRVPFPSWAKDASASDWARLGEAYLRRTERWRARKPKFTDKLPENWTLIEAALAMLPGARVLDCRRDALETCWSCFKQLFGVGRVGWSYDFDDMAEYWLACHRHMDHLRARYPGRVRRQDYEALLADAEGQTRELLAFCGLEFSADCLRFYDAKRAVRTASAAQVRQPIRRDTARTDRYGALLDPLRQRLERAKSTLEETTDS